MFYCLDHLLKTYNPFVCFTKWYCVKVKVKCRIWLINWSIFVTYFVSKLKEVLSHYIGILSCRWFHVYTVQGEPRLTFIIKGLSTKLYLKFHQHSTIQNGLIYHYQSVYCLWFKNPKFFTRYVKLGDSKRVHLVLRLRFIRAFLQLFQALSDIES